MIASSSTLPSLDPELVNDTHSRLNPTRVAGVRRPASVADVVATLAEARARRLPLSIAGGRHAMGGQAFATDGLLLDLGGLRRIRRLDRAAGLVEVEAGIHWPELIDGLAALQPGDPAPWGIRQKQTGADAFSIGGSLAANVHGRSLLRPPIVADVEAIEIVGPDGRLRRASRAENRELFGLAIGGYGLFGVITAATLRLERRRMLERIVEIVEAADLPAAFEERIGAGFERGDFQFAIDPVAPGFLRRGVFACYRPTGRARSDEHGRADLGEGDWRRLVHLAHVDPSRAFDEYARHYLGTSGATYDADELHRSVYLDGYHEELDRRCGASVAATEMITELSVPRERIVALLEAIRATLRRAGERPVYGTVRLVEPDEDTFLAWARERLACVVLNLCVRHDAAGVARAAAIFRALVDDALALGGTFYLTYHRFASPAQVEAAYPAFSSFLRLKRLLDPEERLASDWYRHWCRAFA